MPRGVLAKQRRKLLCLQAGPPVQAAVAAAPHRPGLHPARCGTLEHSGSCLVYAVCGHSV
jgi:hypothetical protein